MTYRHLPFEQYFINTSEDFTHTGRVTYPIKYTAVKYNTTKFFKFFGLSHEVNYEIRYEPDRDVIQIHFQRTLGAIDWVANVFEFASRYYHAIEFEGERLQLRVHHGWGNMYLAIKHEVREKWRQMHEEHPDAATEILGWSLGSGIACLCCQDLNYNFGVKPYLYTFGSVRPFKCTPLNKKRMHRYLASLYTDCKNFADVNDLISYMPPFRGFTMIRRVNVGTDLKRSFFRLIHPLRYHVHYDLPELYRTIVGRTAEEPQERTTDIYLSLIPESPQFRPVLPAERQAQIDATRNEQVKAQRYIVWDALLKGLRHSRGLGAEEAKLKRNESGKWGSEVCGISISHCRTAVAAAVSDEAVGVDMEPLSDARYREALLSKIATEAERKLFPSLSTEQRIAVLWTRKEALFKQREESFFSPIRENAAANNLRTVVISLSDRDYAVSVAAAEGTALRIFEVSGETITERTGFETPDVHDQV